MSACCRFISLCRVCMCVYVYIRTCDGEMQWVHAVYLLCVCRLPTRTHSMCMYDQYVCVWRGSRGGGAAWGRAAEMEGNPTCVNSFSVHDAHGRGIWRVREERDRRRGKPRGGGKETRGYQKICIRPESEVHQCDGVCKYATHTLTHSAPCVCVCVCVRVHVHRQHIYNT
jgi:hypothetical protein